MKEYATFKDLVDEVSKQIGVELRYNYLKLKYKIEGSNAPLEIRNEMGVRVYVSLKKENKELAKYPICVTVFVKDCELTDRNLYEDGVDMSGIDEGDIIDTQALVLSAPLVSNAINNEIISNINQTEVMEDQVYKDKGTLKAVMRKCAIDHRFQWKTDISSEIRPIVVVDGSHLRGSYNGTFVSASTLDGAGNILPLAYGIVDSENDASWTWFFEQFREAHGLKDNMCVVSDRNESIIKSVLRVDIRVKNYLELAGYEKWARVYATVNRGSVMTSNTAECINACLVVARELPIYDFLKEVRQMFGRWNFTNHTSASNTFTTLCGKAQEMLAENEERSVRMTVVATSNYVHSVHHEGSTFIICLKRKTCTCRRFQMDEIPCSYAWAVLKKKFLDPEPYCSDLYKPNTLLVTYNNPIIPLPNRIDWNVPGYIENEVVRPPKLKKLSGRPPKKLRDKSYSELYGKKYKNSCSTCGCKGHNRRSCRNGPRTE
ncbi:hypothetical protein MTR67_042915 [Solanum verrucosum]|uniref:Zinc finger PMZ-type domain-containing protein n=1 Tax=Solanum verrucosum TaxID=315347 RepID=A0AAF0UPD2_SOLVR|nr:hypothetical protein MTR67_042915 [Solanum verrucosum]